MKSKIIYIVLFGVLISLRISPWWLNSAEPSLKEVAFAHLPGWQSAELQKSLQAFQTSCGAFVKQDPERAVGTDTILLQVKDWLPACKIALTLNTSNEQAIKSFFQTWFTPVAFFNKKPIKGLFTGYYLPLVKGSLNQSAEYNVPVYEVPDDLVTVDLGLFSQEFPNRKLIGRLEENKLIPYYTREQINKGAIKEHARVLLWMRSPIDRLFLEIQGSGIVELDDGKRMYIGYNGQNGAPYTALAGVLIKKGAFTREQASMQLIKSYLESHPNEMDEVINQNKSFIFFRKLSLDAALGSQGVALTPGYSLAVDKQWIPLGAPLWLSTSRPYSKNPKTHKAMRRLMIAQDTGGAIKGRVRGDVFWGGGNNATLIAGHMKNEGHYWLLLPNQALSRLKNS